MRANPSKSIASSTLKLKARCKLNRKRQLASEMLLAVQGQVKAIDVPWLAVRAVPSWPNNHTLYMLQLFQHVSTNLVFERIVLGQKLLQLGRSDTMVCCFGAIAGKASDANAGPNSYGEL